MVQSLTSLIVTYNHARFIDQAVQGVQAQRLPGWRHEIVVIDDASDDGTTGILTRLAAGDPRIRLVVSRRNENSNRALMTEIDACSSQYFSLLDGDDYWTDPNKLSVQIEHLERHPSAALCFHDALVVDQDGNTLALHRWPGASPATLLDILEVNFVPTCSAVARVAACQPLPPWYAAAPYGDWPLWVLAARSGELHHLRYTMAVKRHLPSGYWVGARPVQQLAWRLELYARFAATIDSPEARALVARRSWHRTYELAAEFERLGKSADAAEQLRRCLRRRPAGALESYFARGDVTPSRGLALVRRRWLLHRFPWLGRTCDRLGWFAGERLPTFRDIALWSDPI